MGKVRAGKIRTVIKRYLKNIAIWIDQGCNVVLFAGSPDETISSRIGRNQHIWICRFAKRVVDMVFGLGHCERSIEHEECRKGEL
jgi:hypothetical protein